MPRRNEARGSSVEFRSSELEPGAASVFAFLNFASVSKRLIEFRKRQSLFSHGEPADHVFYIQEGGVKLAVTSTAG
jgi:CRP-like cAMP-binding protein